jgi:SSS family solute:Na+ symporter
MAANFWRAWWAWVICASVTVIVSLFTKRKPKDELIGLVKGLTEENFDKAFPLLKRPEFYAVISLIILVILNILFW